MKRSAKILNILAVISIPLLAFNAIHARTTHDSQALIPINVENDSSNSINWRASSSSVMVGPKSNHGNTFTLLNPDKDVITSVIYDAQNKKILCEYTFSKADFIEGCHQIVAKINYSEADCKKYVQCSHSKDVNKKG